MNDASEARLATCIKAERLARNWSLAEMAERSGVSRAMLSKIERGEASPTAVLLVRIASSFGLTFSDLIVRSEIRGGQVLRAADQPKWQDPETGYVRRHLSPPSDAPLELVHVDLPAGASVSFPAASYTFVNQAIWVIAGRLELHEGDIVHVLDPGDCFRLGAPVDRVLCAPGPEPAVYLVALSKR